MPVFTSGDASRQMPCLDDVITVCSVLLPAGSGLCRFPRQRQQHACECTAEPLCSTTADKRAPASHHEAKGLARGVLFTSAIFHEHWPSSSLPRGQSSLTTSTIVNQPCPLEGLLLLWCKPSETRICFSLSPDLHQRRGEHHHSTLDCLCIIIQCT